MAVDNIDYIIYFVEAVIFIIEAEIEAVDNIDYILYIVEAVIFIIDAEIEAVEYYCLYLEQQFGLYPQKLDCFASLSH